MFEAEDLDGEHGRKVELVLEGIKKPPKFGTIFVGVVNTVLLEL